MYSSIMTGAVFGIEAKIMQVETNFADGLPTFQMVGYLSHDIREAGERVRVALQNAGIEVPAAHITINVSPADLPKRGTVLDLPIATGILAAMGILSEADLADTLILGELGLDGEIKPVRGVMPITELARNHGVKTVIVPESNAKEGGVIKNIRVIGVRTVRQLIRYCMEPYATRDRIIVPEEVDVGKLLNRRNREDEFDYADIHGQAAAKRMLEIAAAGFHNVLLIGPPGSGKSMLARRFRSILPPLSEDECMEMTAIYSAAGRIPEGESIITERPFLAPHHSVTRAALAGGGLIPQPGIITLADRGVIFMDEFPEFGRENIDLLRQPMEEHEITISRSSGIYKYPARFQLIAAMNPCPCGYYPDVNKCRCTMAEINRYLQRISGPILDRIDLCAEVAGINIDELMENHTEEHSSDIRVRVMKARTRQKERFDGTSFHFNADMDAKAVEKFCPLGESESRFMRSVFEKMNLSARAYHRTLKTARTIADLSESREIEKEHLSEAIAYRVADRKYWKTDQK